jgi:5'-nucleotidase / UDP-sugar diphosphatase
LAGSFEQDPTGPEVARKRAAARQRQIIVAAFLFLIVTLVATVFLRLPPRASDSGLGQGSKDSTVNAGHSVSVTILQLNDVYEMHPVDGRGGLARVATLRRQLEAENRNTIAVLAGDVVSPSALGQALIDNEKLAGRQMIDMMNRLRLNYAVFGNHEFDLKKDEFAARVKESAFTWIGSNVVDAAGHPFANTKPDMVQAFSGADGATVRVGFFGLTIKSPVKDSDYVRYTDAIAAARAEVTALQSRADVIVALTHLSLAEDEALANAVPRIDLVIGGHEHQNMYAKRGARFTPIAKADANARTVYVHRLRWDADAHHVDVDSRLTPVTDALADDTTVAAAADDWRDRAFAAFRKMGFDPLRVVATITTELDATEASVRTRCTPLTQLIGSGMVGAAPGSVAAIYNSGSIRLDGILPPGDVTEYDTMRVLPYEGWVFQARVRGEILVEALRKGQGLRNSGGFPQTFGIDDDGSGGWKIAGKPLNPSDDYRIAINDYLWDGNEKGLSLFGVRDAKRVPIHDKKDVEWRKATIAALAAAHGGIPCPSIAATQLGATAP